MPGPSYGRTTRQFARLRRRVLEANNICAICAQPGADTVDHIIPLSLAPDLGEDINNLRPAHRTCNSARGAKLNARITQLPASRRW